MIRSIGPTFPETAPSTKEHLAVYCATVLGRRIPHPAYCEDHQSPLDALWDAYADESEFSVWLAMRGSGKTEDLAILSWLESVFKPYCHTTVLGGSLQQSQLCVAYHDQIWSLPHVPKHLLDGEPSGTGFRCKNGSWVRALAASPKSVRGPHPQRLRLDELDEMAQNIFDAALGQPKGNHGIPAQIVASSTLHHAHGMMATLIDNRHERGANLYRWCVEEVREPRGFWTNAEITQKMRQVTAAMWDAEYLLKRPTLEGSVYDFEMVEKAWDRGRVRKWDENITTEAGIDWGHGTTVLHIIQDRKERYVVPETYRWEMVELTERCEAISKLCQKRQISCIYTDSNPPDSNVTLSKILRKNNVRTIIKPVVFGKWKNLGIETVRFLLEKNLLDITDKTFKDKMQKYHYKNPELEQIAKEDDHDPDALTAWAASRAHLLGKR